MHQERLTFAIITMARSYLDNIPTEINLAIQSYLTAADSIILSLTCKRLQKLHARPPLRSFSPGAFWTMVKCFECGNGEKCEDHVFKIQQWVTRNEVLPRLRGWIKRVIDHRDGDISLMDQLDEWDICVGCTVFKIDDGYWTNGHEFVWAEMMKRHIIFEEMSSTKNQELVDNMALYGRICSSCILSEDFMI